MRIADMLVRGRPTVSFEFMAPRDEGEVDMLEKTIAALAGCTSGIEPIFALSYTRRSESLSEREFAVAHPLAVQYRAALVPGDSLLHDLGHGRLTDPPGGLPTTGKRDHARRGSSRPLIGGWKSSRQRG